MLIVGTGSIGSFLAARAYSSGLDMQVFGSPSDRLDALGERFSSAPGQPVAVSQVTEVKAHRLWVVCLKSWQNDAKIRILRQAPRPRAVLVLQNGLNPERTWAQWADLRVERGLCTFGVRTTRPGFFEGGERGEMTLIKNTEFADFFSELGVKTRCVDDLAVSVWHKLAVNASLNVVAALFGVRNGGVLRDLAAARLAESAALEVAKVATALGVKWGPKSAWEITRRVARATRKNVCSTLADFRLGRETEYDFINGEILRLAKRLNVEVPTLQSLDAKFSLLRAGKQASGHLSVRLGATTTQPEGSMARLSAVLPILDSNGSVVAEGKLLEAQLD